MPHSAWEWEFEGFKVIFADVALRAGVAGVTRRIEGPYFPFVRYGAVPNQTLWHPPRDGLDTTSKKERRSWFGEVDDCDQQGLITGAACMRGAL